MIKNNALKILEYAKRVTIPGFDGAPIYDVIVFFINGCRKGSLTTRASSIAFNFFIAVFPTIIFFFTLIPYIPISHFQEELLSILEGMMPKLAYNSVQETLKDIIMNQRGGLLSFGFIAALYFSTNGINAMIEAFNATVHTIETRSWLAQRLISFLLVLILVALTILAISLIVFSNKIMNYFIELNIIQSNTSMYILLAGKWIIILLLFFFIMSFLYYFAPAKKTRFRFISAGSTLATLLIIISSLGFSFYVNNFGSYNKIYGSIGTLIVVLLWMYFNAIGLLIGFELNASICNAKINKS